MSLKSLIKNWPKATTETPDAYKGRKAMNTLAKFMLLSIFGMGAGLIGAAGVIFGGIAFLCGASATVLTAGTWLAGGAAAAFGGAIAGIEFTAKRNAPHIDAYARQQELEKQQNEQRGTAELKAVRQNKLEKKAAKEFNPEAAVRLGSDIKTMRPLKLNARPQQQAQL